MSEGIQAAILFVITFSACMICFKIGIIEGKQEERRLEQRIRATQYELRKNRTISR